MKKIRMLYVVSSYPTLLAALLIVYLLEFIAADPESSKNETTEQNKGEDALSLFLTNKLSRGNMTMDEMEALLDQLEVEFIKQFSELKEQLDTRSKAITMLEVKQTEHEIFFQQLVQEIRHLREGYRRQLFIISQLEKQLNESSSLRESTLKSNEREKKLDLGPWLKFLKSQNMFPIKCSHFKKDTYCTSKDFSILLSPRDHSSKQQNEKNIE